MKKLWGAALMLLLTMTMGVGGCERAMPDSNKPFAHFREKMESQSIEEGAVVWFNHPLTFEIGELIQTMGLSDVVLRLKDNQEEVTVTVVGSNMIDCIVSAPDLCATGVFIYPGTSVDPYVSCDLHGDTAYELVLPAFTRDDGTTIPAQTITFRTDPFPAGYVEDLCAPAPSGPSLAILDGITSVDGITAGVTSMTPLSIFVFGVIPYSPFSGYDYPMGPSPTFDYVANKPYWSSLNVQTFAMGSFYPLIGIWNTSSDTDFSIGGLADGSQKVVINELDGTSWQVRLPAVTIPFGYVLFLYFDENGDSYYAYDNGGSHFTPKSDIDDDVSYANMLTPPDALGYPAGIWPAMVR